MFGTQMAREMLVLYLKCLGFFYAQMSPSEFLEIQYTQREFEYLPAGDDIANN